MIGWLPVVLVAEPQVRNFGEGYTWKTLSRFCFDRCVGVLLSDIVSLKFLCCLMAIFLRSILKDLLL